MNAKKIKELKRLSRLLPPGIVKHEMQLVKGSLLIDQGLKHSDGVTALIPDKMYNALQPVAIDHFERLKYVYSKHGQGEVDLYCAHVRELDARSCKKEVPAVELPGWLNTDCVHELGYAIHYTEDDHLPLQTVSSITEAISAYVGEAYKLVSTSIDHKVHVRLYILNKK